MIVRTTTQIQEYISINASVEFNTLRPYINAAERKNIKPLIGAEQFAIFDVETTPVDAEHAEAYQLAQEAICNFALFYALPILKTQITEAGIFTSTQNDVATASDKDFKELQRSFKRQAHETLDELFKLMESKPAKFQEWITNAVYTKYNNTLVKDTSTFNEHYNIFNSRQTFMALKPEVEIVERQYIKPVIGKDLLIALKASQTNENRIEAKTLIQKSIVCFTVAKIMQNGMFILSAEGMHVRFDVLDYEMVKGITASHSQETQQNKITEAEQILQDALDIITENEADFAEYTAPEESTAATENIIVTQGITMI